MSLELLLLFFMLFFLVVTFVFVCSTWGKVQELERRMSYAAQAIERLERKVKELDHDVVTELSAAGDYQEAVEDRNTLLRNLAQNHPGMLLGALLGEKGKRAESAGREEA